MTTAALVAAAVALAEAAASSLLVLAADALATAVAALDAALASEVAASLAVVSAASTTPFVSIVHAFTSSVNVLISPRNAISSVVNSATSCSAASALVEKLTASVLSGHSVISVIDWLRFWDGGCDSHELALRGGDEQNVERCAVESQSGPERADPNMLAINGGTVFPFNLDFGLCHWVFNSGNRSIDLIQ